MHRSLILGLAFLAACGNNGDIEVPDNAVTLDWAQGEEFHVASTYRAVANKAEHTAVDLDESLRSTDTFDDNWSQEVVWSFQTVQEDYVPDASDELYEYAVVGSGREVAPITVLRAYLDSSLNTDPELSEADPVVYMVFRSDRDRLAAIVSFSNVAGERVEQAWSVSDLDKSYSALSQSMLTAAPTYLAPFTAKYEDATTRLENGSTMSTFDMGPGSVEVAYEDELGGGIIVSGYNEGDPWPAYTDAPDVKSRLLTDAEVDARRLPGLLPDPPEDYDFRAALASTIDLDSALNLDEATMAGGWEGGAPEGYRPWAGSWWPLKKGELIWGQNDRDTVSDQIKADVDPLLEAMDALSAEIREMDADDEGRAAKQTEYREKQSELVDIISGFYNGMLSDLNGGSVVITGGEIVHTGHGEDLGHANDWSYQLDDLSPLDKYALQTYENGHTSPNPWFAPGWEILNQYNPGGESWWGKCNGWAAAAILTNEPRDAVQTNVGGETMSFSVGDVKGLLSNTHYSTYSRFYGERYNGEEQDIADLSPKHFHQIIQFYLRDQQVPFVFDTTASEAVWNFPVWWADVSVTETTPAGEGADSDMVNINTASMDDLQTKLAIDEDTAWWIYEWRLYAGPYQSVEDLRDNWGISKATYEDLKDRVVVEDTASAAPTRRTFDVTAIMTFSTDAVGEEHIDADANAPEGFTEEYSYTLVTDAKGKVLEGTWDNDREHPDFAWVPYNNPLGFPRRGSENQYTSYEYLLEAIGDDFDRE